MKDPDIGVVAALLSETAAREILPRFQALESGEIVEKGPGDLVTIADLETERVLTPALEALVPGSLVVGEEAASKDPSILGRLEGEDSVWVIDPVDGTANFAVGLPLFASMISFVRAGETIAAWIHDPVAGLMATALKGGGAWLGDRRLAVAPPVATERASGTLTFRFGDRALVGRIASRTNLVGSVFSLRCAGQEYLGLLRAQAHFAIYHRILPWDHAAGFLLHREAGGYGRRLDGSAYSPRHQDGGLLLAPDEASWHGLYDTLVG